MTDCAVRRPQSTRKRKDNECKQPYALLPRPMNPDGAYFGTIYCAFYETTLPEAVTAATWERILDPAIAINALVALDETGTVIGFANYVLHPHTWSTETLCYLEDLFVASEARGQNVGHTLIDFLIAAGRTNDWGRVYWHTGTHNAAARRLYDRVTLADDMVRYTVSL